ncbi:DNA-3-methyladenine glycosylase [Cytobacillus spongiae]|uniref:DNA-3-methyladenine glycosylase family protein n=1 Tax=Cytobacillus spongiae TaxID=2901381 RepID=UPI001F43A2E2|nr:DNA-3-methyladenine glycosylase [Cytobacillus spongiae]UII56537.1 DNA-3-methyladenine glycosylase [Cytobacillus spongiae]
MKIAGPYDFDRVLDRLSLDPLHAVDLENRTVKVPLLIDQKPVIAVVTATGTTQEPSFTLAFSDGALKEEATKKIIEIFQWNKPLTDIHQHFQQTDLKGIFAEHFGTPLVLDFDPYACILKCIIHQQLNLAFAHTLAKRFVDTFGFEIDGVPFYPQPETVANLTVEQLRELQFSGRKAEYVIGIGKEIVEGRLNLEAMRDKSDEAIMSELIKLRGVGPWTVQNLLMFGLGRPNLFPTADIGIKNALKKLYQLEEKPSVEQMEEYKKDWDPYLSYASLYLWRSIE